MVRKHVIFAVFKRNFVSYFSSPTGYVFITVFITLSAATAFWQDAFFANNLANLDTLNYFFPYLLLFFVPAVSMALWAEERRQGTDELLLTLPVRDVELILGKYFAAVGIYSVALALAFGLVIVLRFLGRPDLGVMAGTFMGYWFLGSALLAVGAVASLLTSSMTVAFILGALFCAGPVFLGEAGAVVGGALERLVESLGVTEYFQDFASGVLSLQATVYFMSLAAFMLYVNLVLLRRRHLAPGLGWIHGPVRAAAILVIALSVGVLAGRLGWRADLTSEGLHTLTPQTKQILSKIDPSRPVNIQAFVSPVVPRGYVQARETLLALLREFDARGGAGVHLRIVETEKYSPEAREAQERFGIKSERVPQVEEGRHGVDEIFLGVAFTCGAEEVVIPFFHRGIPLEYELARSVGVVTGAKRRKVGIATTDAKLFGGFDFQTFQSSPEWPIVAELKKQYDVVQVSLDGAVMEKYDVLFVALPSSLTQPQMDNLAAYVKKGHPTLLVDDPFPGFNPRLAPKEPKPSPRPGNMFMPPPPGEPKGNIAGLLESIGISWATDTVAWQIYNPHPRFQELPPEYVFVGSGSGNLEAFNPQDPVSSGLQEMVLIFPGEIRPRTVQGVTFAPLLSTSRRSGWISSSELLRRNFPFGGMGLNPARVHRLGNQELALAARVKGALPGEAAAGDGKDQPAAGSPIDVIFVADLDMVSEVFFDMWREGARDLAFDNVTFILNCVDALAGDDSYLPIRKRRARHRTLETVEEKTKAFNEQLARERQAAEDEARKPLEEAQDRLNKKVKEVEERTDLDVRAKSQIVESVRETEQRRFDAEKARIEDLKEAKIELARAKMVQETRNIEKGIKIVAVLVPPIPALFIGLVVLMKRLSVQKRLIL